MPAILPRRPIRRVRALRHHPPLPYAAPRPGLPRELDCCRAAGRSGIGSGVRGSPKGAFRDAIPIVNNTPETTTEVYPPHVPRGACRLGRERAVWRLEAGRAVLIGYRVFAGPSGREVRIPGVARCCEYGLETLVVLAFLVYAIGVSLDKACAVFSFFVTVPRTAY